LKENNLTGSLSTDLHKKIWEFISVYFLYKKTGENRLKKIKNTKIRVKIGL